MNPMDEISPLDAALVLGATARLTRLVTTDDLGRWLVVDRAESWAIRHEGTDRVVEDPDHEQPDRYVLDEDAGPRSKAVSGLSCPYCVGYWLGTGVLGSYALARRNRRALTAWRWVAATLSLNYVVGHVSARVD